MVRVLVKATKTEDHTYKNIEATIEDKTATPNTS